VDILCDAGLRLQLLAAGAVATHRSMQSRQATNQQPAVSSNLLLQLLVLLVQQVQQVPAQARHEFLGSPWGGAVLGMLEGLCCDKTGVAGNTLQASINQHLYRLTAPQQQQQSCGVHKRVMSPLQMMQQLLLPGLLLEPVCCFRAQTGHGEGSSSSSSSSSNEEPHVLSGCARPRLMNVGEGALPEHAWQQ
jgi:hypothetical protein